MIPLVHDFSGEWVVVFGGGPVGARKARRFAREADVVVVSPTFAEESFGGAERVRAAPSAADIEVWLDIFNPALAIAATDDPSVNAAIEAASLEAGILVNRADESGPRAGGSVIVPATVRADPLLVAISSEGTDPALAKEVRERLEEFLVDCSSIQPDSRNDPDRLDCW